MKQTTASVLMVRPTNFGFNEEAAATNSFQNKPNNSEKETIQSLALNEFDAFVKELNALDVDVVVIEDVPNSITPDSIFPNNWFSTHQTGQLILYPMAVPNRRAERRLDIIELLMKRDRYGLFDFSSWESQPEPAFLEGTGSIVFDHQNQLAYAAISPRTSKKVLDQLCKMIGYKPVPFKAYGKANELIYHTNVMMCIADCYVVLGEETIDPKDRSFVTDSISKSGKELVLLTNDQTYDHFAGNMLQIENRKGETVLVMSDTAWNALNENQKEQLNRLNDHIATPKIPTIERIGGGSARCMIAELFQPN